jgi:hypothetical protein
VGTIDPHAAIKVQPELTSGESVYWAGMPNTRVIFHSDDWYAIPFSLMWGGFMTFWEASALGYLGNGSRGDPSLFMALWGIPFVLIGQHLIWGRFLYDAWLKRRTYYAVTNRRVLVLQEAWTRKISATFLEQIPTIEREGMNTGTLWFGPKYPFIAGRRQKTRGWSRFSVGDVPTFADVDDMDSVYRLIVDLREQVKKSSADPSQDLTYPVR